MRKMPFGNMVFLASECPDEFAGLVCFLQVSVEEQMVFCTVKKKGLSRT